MKTKKQIKERIKKLETKVKEYEATTEYEHLIGTIKEEILTLKWVISKDDVSKRKPSPPEPPKDREMHLFGFSRHRIK
jgi:hypothetical protein